MAFPGATRAAVRSVAQELRVVGEGKGAGDTFPSSAHVCASGVEHLLCLRPEGSVAVS